MTENQSGAPARNGAYVASRAAIGATVGKCYAHFLSGKEWRGANCGKLRVVRRSAAEISMSTNLEVLEAEALKLTPADRSHLLERLVASLDADPEIEAAWEREADRREAELESGSVQAVSGSEAIARLRSKLAG